MTIEPATTPPIGAPERVGRVLDAVIAMASDLSLDGVLQRIVDSASELVDAQYGFLGVLNGRLNRRLGTFAVHGLDERHREMIGRLPEGLGLLGLVIDEPEPLRIDDVSRHPGRSGFPALHPTMTSFLGVPIRIHDTVFGNLYLTDKRGGEPFTQEDEATAIAFAAAAGVAIENARLWEEGERQRRWLEASAEIATSLSHPMTSEESLELVIARAREVSGCDAASVLSPDADGAMVVRCSAGYEGVRVGMTATRGLFADVLARREPAVLTGVTGPEGLDPVTLGTSSPVGVLQLHPLPLESGTAVLTLAWYDETDAPLWALDPAVVHGYAQQAALVMQVVRAREAQARVAVLEDRDRIGRDLHDLVIQRLFAIGLSLDSITKRVAEPARGRLTEAVDGLDQTIRDIRRTIFDLSGSAAPGDLRAEVGAVLHDAERVLGFAPVLDVRGPVESVVSDRVAEQLVATLREAMSNVVRHSRAHRVSVLLDVTGGIRLVVTDDGIGLDPAEPVGHGLRNLRHRAQNLGGTCTFDAPEGGGLRVDWRVPRITP